MGMAPAEHRGLRCARRERLRRGGGARCSVGVVVLTFLAIAVVLANVVALVRTLSLAGCGIGPEGCAHLADALAANRSLTELSLSHNALGDAGGERQGRVRQRLGHELGPRLHPLVHRFGRHLGAEPHPVGRGRW